MGPTLAIFSAPKPFTNPHIVMIQRNAILSWRHLEPDVEVFIVGEDEGLAEAAETLGVKHLRGVKCNALGTPLVSSIFSLARNSSSSPLLACINADMLIRRDFLEAARRVTEQLQQFLIVGQRWDLDVNQPIDFNPDWEKWLEKQIAVSGKLHPRGGSDYFIFPRVCFKRIPDFAIGRAGWDNWMIYEGRQRGWGVIDGTESIQVVHQSHDYSHLPNGQPHYRLPETAENVRLAGGARHIFGLWDTNKRLVSGKVLQPAFEWKRFLRNIEVFPLVTLKSYGLGQVFYAIFHPIKAYWELRAWFGKKFKRN